MKKVCICGHFGGHTQCLDGQTVKTKNLYNRLIKDGYTVKKTDTFNPKKRLVFILLQCVMRAFTCRNIIEMFDVFFHEFILFYTCAVTRMIFNIEHIEILCIILKCAICRKSGEMESTHYNIGFNVIHYVDDAFV